MDRERQQEKQVTIRFPLDMWRQARIAAAGEDPPITLQQFVLDAVQAAVASEEHAR